MAGQRLHVRPALGLDAAQVGPDARGQALRIAVADQDVRRQAAEEALEVALAATHRQLQAVGVEQQAAVQPGEAQVGAEHHPVVLDVVGHRAAQVDAEDGNAPAGQPTEQAMDHQPQGEIGEGAAWLAVGLVQGDFRQAAAPRQARREAIEHQVEEAQCHVQRRAHRGLLRRRAGHVGETAELHPSRVHAEELVVHALRDQHPEMAEVLRRDAPIRLGQQLGRDAGAIQQRGLVEAPLAQFQQGFMDQADGDGAFFGGRACHGLPWGIGFR
ncbi:hypothetical protein D9M68_675620 [compost metagenome]